MGQIKGQKQQIFCWDSSVLIEWLQGEQGGNVNQKKFREVEQVVSALEGKKVQLIMSAIVYPECFGPDLSTREPDRLDVFFQNTEIEIAPVNIIIAKKAQKIRARYSSGGKSLKTPDAIHLATAISYNVQAFHTYDGKLLKLDGEDEIDGLKVSKPFVEGSSLPLPFG